MNLHFHKRECGHVAIECERDKATSYDPAGRLISCYPEERVAAVGVASRVKKNGRSSDGDVVNSQEWFVVFLFSYFTLLCCVLL
jgi:hypothetical protein